MKLRLLIQIAVVVSIVLLCTGFGVYSFLRLNSVENRQDFNLYTLVPQDATAILETDRMADLVEDINETELQQRQSFSIRIGAFCLLEEIFVYFGGGYSAWTE